MRRLTDLPSLEEVDVVELVKLERYLDGRLELAAARHFVAVVVVVVVGPLPFWHTGTVAREQITSNDSPFLDDDVALSLSPISLQI